MSIASDSKNRFTQTVDYYDQYRPDYPKKVIELLQNECALTSKDLIVDIGSGTGKLTKLFLEAGNCIYGIEPNKAMREIAEKKFKDRNNFFSIDGSAEATTLRDNFADFIIAAQAFHWFEPKATKTEFKRILKPNGWVVLVWNLRQNTTDFMRTYEELLQKFGIHYQQMKAEKIADEEIKNWFAPQPMHVDTIENIQIFNRAGLKGRLESTSYVPKEGEQYDKMIKAMNELFDRYQKNNQVAMLYTTKIYYAHL